MGSGGQHNEENADFVIYNTCTVRENANLRVYGRLGQLKKVKRANGEMIIAMCGCMMQEPEVVEKIKTSYKFVDIVFGTFNIFKLAELMYMCFTGDEQVIDIWDSTKEVVEELPTSRKYPFKSGVNIMFGCNNFCTYCIIPYIRGHYRSFPMEDLLEEARKLAEGGVKELILIAQETTVYGMDCYGRKALPELLTKLCEIEGIEWIRILYCYPEEITDELIAVMKKEKKICHYLDIPIQHSEDTILKRMGRRTNRAELVSLVEKLRKEIPDIVLRTTLITGFPGETEEEFKNMVDFVDSMEFDRLGVFPYSAEEGTKAAEMDGQITEEVKESRRDEIMALQQEISADKAASRIDDEMSVLIEGYLYEDDIYIGRTYMDAPKVDGNVFVRAEEELISGDIVPVRITGANEYDLMGDVIYADEFTE